MTRYLFDANVFIQAKNIHYQFSFCGGFWDWLVSGHQHGLFFSCKKVLGELLVGNPNDPAKAWAQKAPASFFVDDVADPEVMSEYGKIISWANNSTHYLQAAKDEFAGEKEADAFLLSLASKYGYTLVSQEKPNPQQRNRIPLPTAAKNFNVQAIYIYDLLAKHAQSTFALKA